MSKVIKGTSQHFSDVHWDGRPATVIDPPYLQLQCCLKGARIFILDTWEPGP